MSRSQSASAPRWVSYDEVVEPYERYHVERGYTLQARDIVSMLGLLDGAVILDVGTGTGAAALAALERSSRNVIVGMDPSRPMLRRAVDKGLKLPVVGVVPGLPFCSERFDVVIATLVLTHLRDYPTALADMVRVLRPGGNIGVTAWAGGTSEYMGEWRWVAESFVDFRELEENRRTYVPWEGRFSDPAHLGAALAGAALRDIRVEQREYRVPITAVEYLSRMESSLVGRWMRNTMETPAWDEFRRAAAERFAARFAPSFIITPRVNLAVATK
jgi:SAM-dependent methyltransferase